MTWVVYIFVMMLICLVISILEYVKVWEGLAYFTELLFLLGILISMKVPSLLYRRLVAMKVFFIDQNEKMPANSFIKKMRIIQSVLLDNDQSDNHNTKQNPFLIEILSSIESFKSNTKHASLNYLVDLQEGATLYDPKTNSQIKVG